MNKDLNSLFSDIKEDLIAYLNLKLKVFKLDLYEKSGRASSFLLYGLIFFLIFFFAVLFLFLALGLYIGYLLNNAALGIGLIGFLYLIVLLIFYLKRNSIQNWLMNMFLSEISKNDEDNE